MTVQYFVSFFTEHLHSNIHGAVILRDFTSYCTVVPENSSLDMLAVADDWIQIGGAGGDGEHFPAWIQLESSELFIP